MIILFLTSLFLKKMNNIKTDLIKIMASKSIDKDQANILAFIEQNFSNYNPNYQDAIQLPKTRDLNIIYDEELLQSDNLEDLQFQMLESKRIQQFQIHDYIMLIFQDLFTVPIININGHIFENIYIQYYNQPILLLKNKETQDGFSIYIDLRIVKDTILHDLSNKIRHDYLRPPVIRENDDDDSFVAYGVIISIIVCTVSYTIFSIWNK